MFRCSVRKNLTWGLDKIDETTFDVLVHHLQLESLLNVPGKRLSSGEMQKVSLGRMLVRKPDLLILDEPTANLDAYSRTLIEDEIIRFTRGGGTCILATHMIDQALRLPTEIIRLEQGRITHAEATNIFEGAIETCSTVSHIRIGNSLHVVCADKSEPGKKRFCITASEVVLSTHPLESSMRNSFSGTVTSLRQTSGPVEATIDIGLPLQAYITQESLNALKLSIGSSVVASFKASAVKLL
jgi:molybdopterin-binding protein